MPMLPIPGNPASGVSFARASEVQFIEGEAESDSAKPETLAK